MKYVPAIVLLIGCFIPTVTPTLSYIALGLGVWLAISALAKMDMPYVMTTNNYPCGGEDAEYEG